MKRLRRCLPALLCALLAGCARGGDMIKFAFTVPLSALDALQDIVDERSLALVNGVDRHTDGLPERMGSRLRIEYASGLGRGTSRRAPRGYPPAF